MVSLTIASLFLTLRLGTFLVRCHGAAEQRTLLVRDRLVLTRHLSLRGGCVASYGFLLRRDWQPVLVRRASRR